MKAQEAHPGAKRQRVCRPVPVLQTYFKKNRIEGAKSVPDSAKSWFRICVIVSGIRHSDLSILLLFLHRNFFDKSTLLGMQSLDPKMKTWCLFHQCTSKLFHIQYGYDANKANKTILFALKPNFFCFIFAMNRIFVAHPTFNSYQCKFTLFFLSRQRHTG